MLQNLSVAQYWQKKRIEYVNKIYDFFSDQYITRLYDTKVVDPEKEAVMNISCITTDDMLKKDECKYLKDGNDLLPKADPNPLIYQTKANSLCSLPENYKTSFCKLMEINNLSTKKH